MRYYGEWNLSDAGKGFRDLGSFAFLDFSGQETKIT